MPVLEVLTGSALGSLLGMRHALVVTGEPTATGTPSSVAVVVAAAGSAVTVKVTVFENFVLSKVAGVMPMAARAVQADAVRRARRGRRRRMGKAA